MYIQGKLRLRGAYKISKFTILALLCVSIMSRNLANNKDNNEKDFGLYFDSLIRLSDA